MSQDRNHFRQQAAKRLTAVSYGYIRKTEPVSRDSKA